MDSTPYFVTQDDQSPRQNEESGGDAQKNEVHGRGLLNRWFQYASRQCRDSAVGVHLLQSTCGVATAGSILADRRQRAAQLRRQNCMQHIDEREISAATCKRVAMIRRSKYECLRVPSERLLSGAMTMRLLTNNVQSAPIGPRPDDSLYQLVFLGGPFDGGTVHACNLPERFVELLAGPATGCGTRTGSRIVPRAARYQLRSTHLRMVGRQPVVTCRYEYRGTVVATAPARPTWMRGLALLRCLWSCGA